MKLEKTQCVYVIFNPDLNITKIGVTDNIKIRKKGLECSCGCELIVYYTSPHIMNAIKYEADVHAMFIEKRRIGEWFNITPEEAAEAVRGAIPLARRDSIVERYKDGDSITDIAADSGVTRQAIIAKLDRYGFHDPLANSPKWLRSQGIWQSADPQPEDKPELKKETRIFPENTFLDEDQPKLPLQKLKRIEPNINYNGEWYQVTTYISGEFKYTYTQNIDKARSYRDEMKIV